VVELDLQPDLAKAHEKCTKEEVAKHEKSPLPIVVDLFLEEHIYSRVRCAEEDIVY